MKTQNKGIVEVYIGASFKECVMYCTDKGIISKEREEKIIQEYSLNEDLQHEIVNNFFDFIGINEDEFLKISNEL